MQGEVHEPRLFKYSKKLGTKALTRIQKCVSISYQVNMTCERGVCPQLKMKEKTMKNATKVALRRSEKGFCKGTKGFIVEPLDSKGVHRFYLNANTRIFWEISALLITVIGA